MLAVLIYPYISSSGLRFYVCFHYGVHGTYGLPRWHSDKESACQYKRH